MESEDVLVLGIFKREDVEDLFRRRVSSDFVLVFSPDDLIKRRFR
jgi:hypothetical protein